LNQNTHFCEMTEENTSNEDPWAGLREKLLKTTKWPAIYMFKFIVKSDNQSVAQVNSLFNADEAQIQSRSSKNGKYVSITAKEVMISADAIIDKYKEAAKIDGVMAL